jgi:hypothetical protein
MFTESVLTYKLFFINTNVQDWEPKQRRQHFVARLPNIKQLNGSNVTETERDEAERAFIRYFMDSDQKPAR